MTRADIAFPGHDGTILRGWFYTPQGAAGGRAILMSHGFSALKEMALDDYADVFVEAGFHVLVYDHRGLGASEGEPRRLIDAWVQTRDMLIALDWLAVQPGVDPRRIAVWGSSYSGGEALVVGALDDRVAAVIANVPFVGWPDKLGDATPDAFDRLAARVRSATVGGPVRGPMAVVDDGSGQRAMMPEPEAAEWFLGEAAKPGRDWANQVWLPADTDGPLFDPALALAHLYCPALFIVASGDRQAPAPAAKAAAALAAGGSELVEIEGHHFTPYSGEALQRVADATIGFCLRTF